MSTSRGGLSRPPRLDTSPQKLSGDGGAASPTSDHSRSPPHQVHRSSHEHGHETPGSNSPSPTAYRSSHHRAHVASPASAASPHSERQHSHYSSSPNPSPGPSPSPSPKTDHRSHHDLLGATGRGHHREDRLRDSNASDSRGGGHISRSHSGHHRSAVQSSPTSKSHTLAASNSRNVLRGGLASPRQPSSRSLTSLHHAAKAGDVETVRKLLGRGAQVDSLDDDGYSALHLACKAGQLEAVQELLGAGAGNINLTDGKQNTPLQLACTRGHTAVAAELLARGASVGVADRHGWAPIHWACEGGHTDLVRKLVAAGARPDARTKANRTPLHMACHYGHPETAQLLLRRGANLLAEDDDGRRPGDDFHDSVTRDRRDAVAVALGKVQGGAASLPLAEMAGLKATLALLSKRMTDADQDAKASRLELRKMREALEEVRREALQKDRALDLLTRQMEDSGGGGWKHALEALEDRMHRLEGAQAKLGSSLPRQAEEAKLMVEDRARKSDRRMDTRKAEIQELYGHIMPLLDLPRRVASLEASSLATEDLRQNLKELTRSLEEVNRSCGQRAKEAQALAVQVESEAAAGRNRGTQVEILSQRVQGLERRATEHAGHGADLEALASALEGAAKQIKHAAVQAEMLTERLLQAERHTEELRGNMRRLDGNVKQGEERRRAAEVQQAQDLGLLVSKRVDELHEALSLELCRLVDRHNDQSQREHEQRGVKEGEAAMLVQMALNAELRLGEMDGDLRKVKQQLADLQSAAAGLGPVGVEAAGSPLQRRVHVAASSAEGAASAQPLRRGDIRSRAGCLDGDLAKVGDRLTSLEYMLGSPTHSSTDTVGQW